MKYVQSHCWLFCSCGATRCRRRSPGVVLCAQQQLRRPVPDGHLHAQQPLHRQQHTVAALASPVLAVRPSAEQHAVRTECAARTTTPFSDSGRSGSRTKRARPKSPTFTLPCACVAAAWQHARLLCMQRGLAV